MIEIGLESYEVWDYFQQFKDEIIGQMVGIAENNEYGIVIYITSYNGYDLNVIVEADDIQLHEEKIFDGDQCDSIIDNIYDEYLEGNAMQIMESIIAESDDELENEISIEEREEELNDIVYKFYKEVVGFNRPYPIGSEQEAMIIEDLKDHFLEYMARKHEILIYRPMYLEDENGEDFFDNYPYECMEFDDEDNPIYQ